MGIKQNAAILLHARYPKGPRNLISDVAGVTVGHKTLISDDHTVNTGVTVIKPHPGNCYCEKVFAAAEVINGFGKSAGLVQIGELGTLESPIYLTNTLSVGTVITAEVKQALAENPQIGVSTGTVNCVVCECNDGSMNDIRGLHVTEEDAQQAFRAACADFEEGAVGAGTGMKMMGLKGGIGAASRLVTIQEKTYTVGALALTNYGSTRNLTVGGDPLGRRIAAEHGPDQGSCILILATDVPLSDRQLGRAAKRSAHALARTGSYSGNGSGDIAIAFSTANRVAHFPKEAEETYSFLHDDFIDPVFEASVEAMEEALLSSMLHACPTDGIRGKHLAALGEYL